MPDPSPDIWPIPITTAEPPTPTRYTCRQGLHHLVVGKELHEGEPATFCKWTACGQHDVPVDPMPVYVYAPFEVTCAGCLASVELRAMVRHKETP